MLTQTREHLFCHCSQWRDRENTLLKEVGKATGWRGGRCRHVQVSELFCMEKWGKAVMDFLVATDFWKFQPKCTEEEEEEEQEPAGSPQFHHISFVVYIDHQMLCF